MNNINDDLYAKRIKIHNRWVNGFYQNIRSYTIWVTLGFYFLMPWVTWQGNQAILFDIAHRKFHIFNFTFWPQEFYLLVMLILMATLGLFLGTRLAGRLWCGYTCPQTVWTKCFMWLEYMIEGDRNARIKHDQNPWASTALIRRAVKHLSWFALALYTAMTFVSYFAGAHHVFMFNISTASLGAVLFFTFATYFNAGWMREQLCLHICPYARFQSVMLDENTLVVSYDPNRGEPRGSLKNRKHDKSCGDCIDCSLCVQVCPTGIDIRNGLQMACIGCAACIDICDSVMEKVNLPKGLIRYSTQNALQHKKTKVIRTSVVVATILLTSLASAFLWLLLHRMPLQVNVKHEQQNLYRLMPNGEVENSYVLSIDNMSQNMQTFAIVVEKPEKMRLVGVTELQLPGGATTEVPITLIVEKKGILEFTTPIHFIVQSKEDPKVKRAIPSNFFSP